MSGMVVFGSSSLCIREGAGLVDWSFCLDTLDGSAWKIVLVFVVVVAEDTHYRSLACITTYLLEPTTGHYYCCVPRVIKASPFQPVVSLGSAQITLRVQRQTCRRCEHTDSGRNIVLGMQAA